jgi:hypothetical protein
VFRLSKDGAERRRKRAARIVELRGASPEAAEMEKLRAEDYEDRR